MALGDVGRISLAVVTLGILAFILGVVAENKKPAQGNPITGKGVVICKYPHDPTIQLGIWSIIFSFLSSVSGMVAIFFPYKGRSIPTNALWRSMALIVFLAIATVLSFLALALLMWVTITESLHRTHNIHNIGAACPTAKTGLFGGAAFLALDASLFWLICQMLTLNAREDYEDEEEDTKGQYGQVMATDYIPAAVAGVNPKV
eukprot:Gb_03887 [translate_table: standard]